MTERGYNPAKRYELITIGDPTTKYKNCANNCLGMIFSGPLLEQQDMYNKFEKRFGNKPNFGTTRLPTNAFETLLRCETTEGNESSV